MFHRPSRLFLFKFIGLWGGQNINSKLDEKTKSDPELEEILKTGLANNNGNKCPNYNVNINSAIETSRREIVNLLLKKGIPGLTICVSKNRKVLWKTAFGFCDVENQLACDNDAKMRIASISKCLFATSIVGPMIQDGKLDLNSSIYLYLSPKEFPRKKFNGQESDITIRQLLSHTSGIPHYSKTDEVDYSTFRPLVSNVTKVFLSDDQYNRKGFYQRETFRDVLDALKTFKDEPLACEPGTKYKYTTYGYVLLSAVMQKIHQMDEKQKNEKIQDFWIKVLRENWRMENTYLDEDEVIMPKRAKYYSRIEPYGELINSPYTDNSVKWAGGGLVSTTEDLVRFANTLIDCYKGRKSEPLKAEALKLLWDSNGSSYTLGFQRISDKSWRGREKLVVYHSGAALGASSILMIYPESEVVIAILVNLTNVDLKALSLSIADEFEKCDIAN